MQSSLIQDDDRYTVKNVNLLASRGKQAFLEYVPIQLSGSNPAQIYRSFNYGAALEIFMLDKRSYRGQNSPNRQLNSSSETAFLGNQQLRWLKQRLLNCKATTFQVALQLSKIEERSIFRGLLALDRLALSVLAFAAAMSRSNTNYIAND